MSTRSPNPAQPKPQQAPPQTGSRTRYGNRERGAAGVSGKVIAVFAVVMAALLVFTVARAFIQQQARPINAEFITQERLDDETARLWIEVDRKDTSQDAYCIVFAVDYEHGEIGRREVFVPAGGEELQRIAVDLPTRSPVASGRVYGCSQTIPPYMDTSTVFLGAR